MTIGGKNNEWAAYVARVMEKHNASHRSQRTRTGISRSTVSEWLAGTKPGLDGALAFIRGFGEDESEGLTAAGYGVTIPRIKEGEHNPGIALQEFAPTGSETLITGISALQQELGRPILISFDHSIRAGLTVEEAEELLAHIRQQAEAGVF